MSPACLYKAEFRVGLLPKYFGPEFSAYREINLLDTILDDPFKFLSRPHDSFEVFAFLKGTPPQFMHQLIF